MRWRGLLCCADCILRLAFVSIIAMFLFGTPLLNWSKEMWFFLYWHLKTNWYERFETCCDSINSRKYCLTMKTSNNKLWLHQFQWKFENPARWLLQFLAFFTDLQTYRLWGLNFVCSKVRRFAEKNCPATKQCRLPSWSTNWHIYLHAVYKNLHSM